MAKLLFIVAPTGFRDEELFDTRRELEGAGHTITVASTRAGTCTGVKRGEVEATVALSAVTEVAFDGVVFVGGPGARVLFDDPDAHAIAQRHHRAGRVIAAICIAPTVLARAALLAGRRVTAFDSETSTLAAAGAILAPGDVVVDGQLVTASGPAHARRFGREIARVLASRTSTIDGPRAA